MNGKHTTRMYGSRQLRREKHRCPTHLLHAGVAVNIYLNFWMDVLFKIKFFIKPEENEDVFCNIKAGDTNYLNHPGGVADDYTAGGAGFGTLMFSGKETQKEMLEIVLR